MVGKLTRNRPSRLLGRLQEHRLGIMQIIEHLAAALVEKLAFGREPDGSRAALEQSHTQRLFQSGDGLADGRCRNTQYPTRTHKAEALGGLHKGGNAAEAFDWFIRAFHSVVLGNLS
jgi:hypothetical protein